MAKRRIDLIDRLQYLALRLGAMVMHCFPVNENLKVAQGLGDLVFRFDRKHRERALGNLLRSFPELSEEHRQLIARRSFQELFMLMVEVLFTTRLIRRDTWERYVELHEFAPVLELLLKDKQGLIMITAHYGNFEISGYVMAVLGFPMSSVARPLDNPHVSRWVFGLRAKNGQHLITKKGATVEVTQVLDDHGTVAFVADQNAGSKGLFVDFFGRKASTYKSIGLLAMQYDVPIVVGYARRLQDQFKFSVGAQEIIRPDEWKNQEDPLRYITQRYNKAIEAFIRVDPGQYWWVHRRWKSRPKGETPEAFD